MSASTHSVGLKKATVAHYKKAGRHVLPWRKRSTPYRVFVSEVMLQQTQVDRVVPKFNAFIKTFPSWRALAEANLTEVYARWQGLGYNRRAKYIRDAARLVVERGKDLPNDLEFIQSLPGVGPYTAGAVRAFAYGESAPFIETNIKTAVLHHCFAHKRVVRNEEILKVLTRLEPKRGAPSVAWYSALMDYGAHLKSVGVQLNAKTVGYKKQTAFKGSLRQVRGAVMRSLGRGSTIAQLKRKTKFAEPEISLALSALIKESLVQKKNNRYTLSP